MFVPTVPRRRPQTEPVGSSPRRCLSVSIASIGRRPALMPERFIAEELATALAAVIAPSARILLARAAGARDILPERLRAAGARVDVLETYRAVPPPDLRPRLAAGLAEVDMVTFTSASTVRHFVGALDGHLADRITVA